MALHANAAPTRGINLGTMWRRVGGSAPTGAKLGKFILWITILALLLYVFHLPILAVVKILWTISVLAIGLCNGILSLFNPSVAVDTTDGPLTSGPKTVIARPLTESERVRVIRDYQTEPEASLYWEVSGRQRSLTIDRSPGQPQRVFLMNASYAQGVTGEVTAGSFGTGAEQPMSVVQSPHDRGQNLHGTIGLYHGEKDRLQLHQPVLLELRWDHQPYAATDPEKSIGVYFSDLRDEEGCAVIRTQGSLPAGHIVPWGIIPTHFGGQPLKVEGTIVFLDSTGQYLTALTTKEAPLLWHVPFGKELTAEDVARGADASYRVECTAPIHLIRITEADALAGRRLWIMMPKGGYCFVNWKITGIIDKEE